MDANPIGQTARPIESLRQSNDYADCVLDDQVNPSVDNDLGGAEPGSRNHAVLLQPEQATAFASNNMLGSKDVSRVLADYTHVCR